MHHSNDSHQCPILPADFVIFYYGTENEEAIQAGEGSEWGIEVGYSFSIPKQVSCQYGTLMWIIAVCWLKYLNVPLSKLLHRNQRGHVVLTGIEWHFVQIFKNCLFQPNLLHFYASCELHRPAFMTLKLIRWHCKFCWEAEKWWVQQQHQSDKK